MKYLKSLRRYPPKSLNNIQTQHTLQTNKQINKQTNTPTNKQTATYETCLKNGISHRYSDGKTDFIDFWGVWWLYIAVWNILKRGTTIYIETSSAYEVLSLRSEVVLFFSFFWLVVAHSFISSAYFFLVLLSLIHSILFTISWNTLQFITCIKSII